MTIAATEAASDDDPFARVLDAVIARGSADDWKGHDKHDGLNSPVVHAVAGWSRPTRLLALQAIMRSPVDLRAVLRVPAVENPKGLALFLQAALARWQLSGAGDALALVEGLVDRLDRLRTPEGRWSGRGWGYQYPWQDLGFFAPRGTPNAVVSAFVCDALIDAHAATGSARCMDMVAEALPFFREDLPRLVDSADHLCLAYMPMPMTMRVMDVSALVGALFARVGRLLSAPDLDSDAARLLRYVLDQQTAEGAWWYTDPPEASPVRIDNYHTGFILDAIWRYMASTGDHAPVSHYAKGLQFYACHLFEPDGAPRWMSDRPFPHDIHGSAQGVITFCRHAVAFPGLAERIAGWAIAHLYDGNGKFWYRRTRTRTDKRFFLRWNNGWMARALADLLLYRSGRHRVDGEAPLQRAFAAAVQVRAASGPGHAHA